MLGASFGIIVTSRWTHIGSDDNCMVQFWLHFKPTKQLKANQLTLLLCHAQEPRTGMQGLEPLPMWDECTPVSILCLKKALLEGQLELEVPLRQLNLTLPLRVLIHERLPGLIQQLLTQLQERAPGCKDISLESSATRELLSIMGDAMCLLVVLGDTRTEATIRAQGFHVRDPGRPSPPGLIQQAVVWHVQTPVHLASLAHDALLTFSSFTTSSIPAHGETSK